MNITSTEHNRHATPQPDDVPQKARRASPSADPAGSAILAAVLAVVGVYGVMSYSVAQRTVEIGIRLALGEGRRSIAALVLREALLLLAAGMLLGLALTVAAGRPAGTMLFALQPGDPATLAAACALLTTAACAASYLPARHAARTDPLITLRRE